MVNLEKKKVMTFLLFFSLFIISSSFASSLSISPNELRIQNVESREYTFIVLLSNGMEGLVDVELKSSYDDLTISPNRFMLNAGEKRSVRVLLNTRSLEDGIDMITLQPFANGVPISENLKIFLNSEQAPAEVDVQGGILTTIREPEIVRIIIYGLLAITALMIIIIFIPEIKKNINKINSKSIEITDKKFYNKMNAKSKDILKRMTNAEKRINTIIEKVERFHSDADKWLRDNTGGKYGLE